MCKHNAKIVLHNVRDCESTVVEVWNQKMESVDLNT